MDTTMYLQVPSGATVTAPKDYHSEAPGSVVAVTTDKYTASIELSNACRQFYKSRVEAAHCIKTRWEKHANSLNARRNSSSSSTSTTTTSSTMNDNDKLNTVSSSGTCDNARSSASSSSSSSSKTVSTERKQRNSIDEAMEKLRTEMASLMDQDLSLMKQLLTLNETIEELKWQRRYYYSRRSLPDSSQDLHHSDCSLSDTDMYDSEDDVVVATAAAAAAAHDRRHHQHQQDVGSSIHTATTTVTTVSNNTPVSSSPCKSAAATNNRSHHHHSHSPSHSSSHSSPSHTHSYSSSSSSSPRRKYGVADYRAESEGVKGKRCVDTQILVNGSSVKVFHGEQNSFDSGIHEPPCDEDYLLASV